MGGRFVLTIKNKDTSEEIFKARFAVQGHKDSQKFSLFAQSHDFTCKVHSASLVFSVYV
jgi:hypothetical protein